MNNVMLGDYLKVTRVDGEFIEYGLTVKVVGKEVELFEYGEEESRLKTIMLDGTVIKISEDDDFEIIEGHDINLLFLEG